MAILGFEYRYECLQNLGSVHCHVLYIGDGFHSGKRWWVLFGICRWISSRQLWCGSEGRVSDLSWRLLSREGDRQQGVHWIIQTMTHRAPWIPVFVTPWKKKENHLERGQTRLPQSALYPQPSSSLCLSDRSGLNLLHFLFSLWWFLSWEH